MTEKDKELFELQRKVEELEERIAIMTEGKPEIVMCKDCKFWYKDECSHLCKITGDLHPANWFCADGERRE